MVLAVLAVVAGVILLAFAADQFVIGAARVALAKQLSPVLVGVVIVGFGTSSPELLVSTIAAARGDIEVAVGNVVGSNIANLSLLLGVGALLVPIAVSSTTVRREVPLAIGAAVAVGLAVQNGLERWEGVLLVVAMVVVLVWLARTSGPADDVHDPLADEVDEFAGRPPALRAEVLRTALGLIGTVVGAQVLLLGALEIAERADLGEGFVGATLVAIGTSLPELVTVVQSARRAQTDLIVGNLLGSNLFNALAVAGLAALVGPGEIAASSLTVVGAGAAVVISLFAGVAMLTRGKVERWEGAVLVAAYCALVPFLA